MTVKSTKGPGDDVKGPPKGKDLTIAEKMKTGDITFQDYKNHFSFSVGTIGIYLYIFVSIVCSILQLTPSYVITLWSAMPLKEQQESNIMAQLLIWSIFTYMIAVFFRAVML